jgi:creatinine amidohydrolase/Fe(II)-dependent formamide hydrolase-like protein
MELDRGEIAALDREATVFLSAVAPVEVHGGHLPVGTDLFVADAILKKTAEGLKGWTAVRLPDIPLGAQAIPAPGSMRVKGKLLEAALLSWGGSLAALGFKYWMAFDNHGGATHQLAEASAARKLKRRGFNLIVPFVSIFDEMVKNTAGLGLGPGRDGGMRDAHAGTNETSLMLALSPERVRPAWKDLPRWFPEKHTAMGNFGRLLGQPFLGMAMDWFAAPDNPHYVGCPSEALAEAGERMAAYHVKRGLELLDAAKKGTYVPPRPYPRFVSAIVRLFE